MNGGRIVRHTIIMMGVSFRALKANVHKTEAVCSLECMHSDFVCMVTIQVLGLEFGQANFK